jgi:hypothetical protein
MNELISKLNGANMDIDLATPEGEIPWEQDKCPWNEAFAVAGLPDRATFGIMIRASKNED